MHAGNPFVVEVGIVYGGQLNKEETVQILRFAHRVPLMYQQGACAITQAIEAVDWRRYGLEQRGGQGIPFGPAIVLVHVASTKIPFTPESKEAIANIPEIREEIELAVTDAWNDDLQPRLPAAGILNSDQNAEGISGGPEAGSGDDAVGRWLRQFQESQRSR